jgi:hypothetical protein
MAKGEKLTTADFLMMQNASDGDFSFSDEFADKKMSDLEEDAKSKQSEQ